MGKVKVKRRQEVVVVFRRVGEIGEIWLMPLIRYDVYFGFPPEHHVRELLRAEKSKDTWYTVVLTLFDHLVNARLSPTRQDSR